MPISSSNARPSPVFNRRRPIIFEPWQKHEYTFFILHGRGDTASNFAPFLLLSSTSSGGQLQDVLRNNTRLIFLQAGVCCFYPQIDNQWFDISSLKDPGRDQENQIPGLSQHAAYIRELIEAEMAAGISSEKIVLMGLSQGCAQSLFVLLTTPLQRNVQESSPGVSVDDFNASTASTSTVSGNVTGTGQTDATITTPRDPLGPSTSVVIGEHLEQATATSSSTAPDHPNASSSINSQPSRTSPGESTGELGRLGAVIGMSGWLPFAQTLNTLLDTHSPTDIAPPSSGVASSTPLPSPSSNQSPSSNATLTVLNTLCQTSNLPPFPTPNPIPTPQSSPSSHSPPQSLSALPILSTPVFLGHGLADNKVLPEHGLTARDTLTRLGFSRVDWHGYENWGHWWKAPDEIDDLLAFLRSVGFVFRERERVVEGGERGRGATFGLM